MAQAVIITQHESDLLLHADTNKVTLADLNPDFQSRIELSFMASKTRKIYCFMLFHIACLVSRLQCNVPKHKKDAAA